MFDKKATNEREKNGTRNVSPSSMQNKTELIEADRLIKDEVDMLVERICENDLSIRKCALSKLLKYLQQSDGAVGSIPKHLKYIRSHYTKLEELALKFTIKEHVEMINDILSMIAINLEGNYELKSLEFKILGCHTDLHIWGHEYLRNLAGVISKQWCSFHDNEEKLSIVNHFVEQIVDFMFNHQDEPTAIDLLIEINQIGKISKWITDENFSCVSQYLLAVSKYLPTPEDKELLVIVYELSLSMKMFTVSLRISFALNDESRASMTFSQCSDPLLKKQMAFVCARARFFIPQTDEELSEITGNLKLSDHYRLVAKEFDALKPKTVDEVYKVHLLDKKPLTSTTNNYMLHLANTLVNGLINVGFGSDALTSTTNFNWLEKFSEHRKMTAVASIGLIHLWDSAQGLQIIDPLTYAEDPNIKAGAILASGIIMCGIKSPFDPMIAIASNHLTSSASTLHIRIATALALGFAYSGTKNKLIKEKLCGIIYNNNESVSLQCYAAYALALVFSSSCDEDITEALIMCLMEKTEEQLKEPHIPLLVLSLGALVIGRQELVEPLLDMIKTLNPSIAKYTEVVVLCCAYAATGSVTTIQKLFQIIAELPEKEKSEDAKDNAETKNINTFNPKTMAIIGVGIVSQGEALGMSMSRRALMYPLISKSEESDVEGRQAVPLALALLSISTPNMNIIETLSKLSHDADRKTAQNAVLGLGIVGAGTNNARIATLLRNITSYYHKDRHINMLYTIRISQGLLNLGKGHATLCPSHPDKTGFIPSAMLGILAFVINALNSEHTLLGDNHFMIYTLTSAIQPRMLLTLGSNLELLPTQIRVGQAVDTVAVPGKPKSITGFQTQMSPLLLPDEDKAEIVQTKMELLEKNTIVTNVVILKEKEI